MNKHPYRAPLQGPTSRVGYQRQAIARWAVLLSVVPLSAMALGFFFPYATNFTPIGAVLAIPGGREECWAIGILWPMHLSAAALAGILGRVFWAQRTRPHSPATIVFHGSVPSRNSQRWAKAVALLPTLGSLCLLLYCLTHLERNLLAHLTQLSALGGLGLTVLSILLYRWRRPRRWQGLGLALPAFLGANLGNAMLYALVATDKGGAFLEWGGFLVLGCLGTITVLSLVVVAACIRLELLTQNFGGCRTVVDSANAKLRVFVLLWKGVPVARLHSRGRSEMFWEHFQVEPILQGKELDRLFDPAAWQTGNFALRHEKSRAIFKNFFVVPGKAVVNQNGVLGVTLRGTAMFLPPSSRSSRLIMIRERVGRAIRRLWGSS